MSGLGGYRGTVLGTRWELHDIDDVEAFCQQVIKRSGFHLLPDQRDELLLQLLADTWRLTTRYKPDTGTFSTLAGGVLPKRAIDWYRKEFGRTRYAFKDRTYERDKTVLVELDERSFAAPDVDPAERDDPPEPGVDADGSIPASAYYPPRYLFPRRGVQRPPARSAESNDERVKAA